MSPAKQYHSKTQAEAEIFNKSFLFNQQSERFNCFNPEYSQ